MSKVIITRPLEFALPLQTALAAHNIDSFIFPTIDIQAIPITFAADNIDYFIYASRNAVEYGAQLLTETSRTLAIGQGTYNALQNRGYTPIITPRKPYNSEQFLLHPKLPIQAHHHVAIVKGCGGRDLLYKSLEKKIASVQTIDVYKRQITAASPSAIAEYELLLKDNCRAIFINSIETLQNLITLTPKPLKNTLLNQQLITGSARVIKTAKNLGFTLRVLQASSTIDADMIACLRAQA